MGNSYAGKKLPKEVIAEIIRLAKETNLSLNKISHKLGLGVGTVHRYGRAYRPKKSVSPTESRKTIEYNNMLNENIISISKVKQLLNDINIGEEIEFSIKNQFVNKRKRATHKAIVKQKNDHALFVVLEKNGRQMCISNYQLLTKEIRLKVLHSDVSI